MSQRNKRRPTSPEQAWRDFPKLNVRSFKPVHDYIVVRLLGPQETASGIVVLEDNEETAARAHVLSVGPGRESDLTPGHRPAAPCVVGDYISILPLEGCSCFIPFTDTVGDNQCAVIRFRDVVGVFGHSAVEVERDSAVAA